MEQKPVVGEASVPAAPAAQYGSEVLCFDCAVVFCPHGDRLHFHHDGCPCCDAEAVPAAPAAVAGQRREAARYLRDLAERLLSYPTDHYKEAYEALLAEAGEEESAAPSQQAEQLETVRKERDTQEQDTGASWHRMMAVVCEAVPEVQYLSVSTQMVTRAVEKLKGRAEQAESSLRAMTEALQKIAAEGCSEPVTIAKAALASSGDTGKEPG